MSEEQFDFEKLTVYQRALEYIDFVYEITKAFPKEELYALADQFRRAATSVCLNIAEGSGGTSTEFRHYLKISRKSVRECVAITEIAFRHSYVNSEERGRSRSQYIELSKMHNGLMKSLAKKGALH